MEFISLILIVYMYSHMFWSILPRLYPQPNCSKQSHQGTVQSQLFQPCRQLLVWDHRGRHDIAWPSWDCEGVPNETRSKLQTNWHIYEALSKWIATAFLVWNWEIIIIFALLKGPCGFKVNFVQSSDRQGMAGTGWGQETRNLGDDDNDDDGDNTWGWK